MELEAQADEYEFEQQQDLYFDIQETEWADRDRDPHMMKAVQMVVENTNKVVTLKEIYRKQEKKFTMSRGRNITIRQG